MPRMFDQPSSDDTTADDATYQCWNCGALCDRDTSHACDTEHYGPFCKWCDRPLPDGETDYCDAICVIQAERDNREDR